MWLAKKLINEYGPYFINPVVYYFRPVNCSKLLEKKILSVLDKFLICHKNSEKTKWVKLKLSKIINSIDSQIKMFDEDDTEENTDEDTNEDTNEDGTEEEDDEDTEEDDYDEDDDDDEDDEDDEDEEICDDYLCNDCYAEMKHNKSSHSGNDEEDTDEEDTDEEICDDYLCDDCYEEMRHDKKTFHTGNNNVVNPEINGNRNNLNNIKTQNIGTQNNIKTQNNIETRNIETQNNIKIRNNIDTQINDPMIIHLTINVVDSDISFCMSKCESFSCVIPREESL